MIDVTVKTLDSQNHVFTLEDDITVKDFKEHITETVNIPVDLQRLIYCGRVLQDEKRLSEYDVNGKVIHLVQRAPPSVTQRSSSRSNQNQGPSSDFLSSPRIQYRQTQFHGNPMYVGSVSIPADVLEGSDWPIPQLSGIGGGSSVTAHLELARRMLEQANRVIDRMDNANATPSSSSSGSTTSETEQAASTVNASSSTTESTTDAAQDQEDTAEQLEPVAGSSAIEALSETANDSLVPPQLAVLLDKLLTTQDRLKPFIRERILLSSYNPGSSSSSQSETTAEQNQRIIDGVTECFHFLSHAQHALSDISINMQQPPPRTLRCRPMIIQPSTILQAGMPIQVEAHISLHGQSDSSNADSEDGSNNGTSRGTSIVPPTSTASRETTPATDAASDNQQQATSEQRQSAQPDAGFGSLFNFPNNVEVVMEMGPQTPRMWSFSTGGQSQGTGTTPSNNNNNTTTANNNTNGNGNTNGGSRPSGGGNGSDPFPWGAAPSPDIIRNLIQAVAGYMAQGTAGVATSSTASSSTQSTQNNSTSSNNSTPTIIRHRTMTVALGGSDSSPSSGQTSGQTRTNTDTHPTTSTQTRTTPRTHVFHQHAQALGVAQSLDFDPFLPCNSQHLRRNQQGQGNTTTSTQTGQNSFVVSNSDTSTPLQTGAFRFSSGGGGGGGGSGSSTPRFTTVAGSVQLVNNNINQPLAEAINELSSSSSRSVTLNSFLINRGINLTQTSVYGRQRSLLQRLFLILSKITINDWFRILNGSTTPFTDVFARSLRNTLRTSVPPRGNYARLVPQLFIEELRPYLERTLDDENAIDENMRRIDIRATIEQLIVDRGEGIVRSILNEESSSGIVAAIRTFAVDLTRLIRYCLRGAGGYDRVVAKFANNVTRGTHELFREWILNTVVDWFWRFARSIPTTSDDSITAVIKLRYHDSAPSPAAPRPAQTPSESPLSQSSAQPEPEPMETDAASSDQPESDPLDDGEDVPTTFPGHDQLLPEWVPIIARDGSRQRRQLQLGLSNDNVTSLSDAYLATMPNKRRKLVEQQKPTLLTNSTSNHSVIPSSMERLVRDSVGRAGVEEVDGAASAVAADPTVRRAFGQAIRECLNPRRFQTPDFPDSLRFPNATRLFSESDRSSKQ